ncbi:unnamed protein product, partial [Meganyctiphanes norvegica]
ILHQNKMLENEQQDQNYTQLISQSNIPKQQQNHQQRQHLTEQLTPGQPLTQHLQPRLQFSHLQNHQNQNIQLQQHQQQEQHHLQQQQVISEESIGTIQRQGQQSSRLRVQRVPPFMTGVRFTPGSIVPTTKSVSFTQTHQQE